MESLLKDFRFGARILARSPGITAAVILALALGIGANSAMFSVVDALLLHPLRYSNPATLALIWDRDPQGIRKLHLLQLVVYFSIGARILLPSQNWRLGRQPPTFSQAWTVQSKLPALRYRRIFSARSA